MDPTANISFTILGSGTAVPWRGRSSPGIALGVEGEESSCLALIDPSAGSSHRAAASGYDFSKLTHVVFSHYHPDHTGDLVPILFALKNPNYHHVGGEEPLRLVGPVGLSRLVRQLTDIYGDWVDLGHRVVVEEIDRPAEGRFFTIGPVEVTWYPVDHTENSVAYRFETRAGRVLAYSGDTDFCDGIIEAARGAETLVLDCAFPEGQKRKGHLIPSEAGRIAAAANVRKLVLTHLYPECWGEDLVTPCRTHYGGDVFIAEDGLTVHL